MSKARETGGLSGTAQSAPPMSDLLRVFARIGIFSFGGPAAQIAVMHRELVEQRPWLSEDGFLRGLSFCMLLPGPEAMQLATYTGWRLRGLAGGLAGGLLFVLPGALVTGLLVWLYAAYGALPAVQSAFLGIKAAVVVIVLQALRRLAGKALDAPFDWALAGFGFAALFLFSVPFPLVVLGAAAAGLLRGSPGAAPLPQPPPPASTAALLRTAALWGTLWLAPLILLTLAGADFLAAIGWFFAKLAVVTFGGAYAVLAYMSQTVVEQHGWISAGQMIDALGLAETTPGPLILVTQFTAMLAGILKGGLGLGLAAGAVALWATFMPCFLWIFAAAPHVERLAAHPRLGAALRAVTAAVTGVILNLSLWFLLNILFHDLNSFQAGPLSLPWPAPGALNGAALALVLFAPAVAWAVRGSLFLTLTAMAFAGLLLPLLPAFAAG